MTDTENRSPPMRTPGPWAYTHREGADYDLVVYRQSDSNHEICQMFHTKSKADPFNEEGEANARLIAAAPELLEALKALYERGIDLGDGYYNVNQPNWKSNDILFKEAEAAIA